MQVANLFVNAQAQTAKTGQAAGASKDSIVRASETKNSGSSFDRELSRAKTDSARSEVAQQPEKAPEEVIKEVVQEVAKEAAGETVGKADQGEADVTVTDALVEAEAKDEPVDLQAAADSATMLIALAGSAMVAQPQLVEEPVLVEQAETVHPDMTAIKAETPIESVTELAPQALEALIPQNDATVKQAVQNQQLIDMLQQKAPVEATSVEVAKTAVQPQMTQPMAEETATFEQPMAAAGEQILTSAMQPQMSQRRVDEPETEIQDTDKKGNILEGIPLTVEDRRTVLPQAEAQMSGDMQEQPKHNGGQQQALTNARTGEKIEQGTELPEEAAFDTVKPVKQVAAETVQPIVSDSFAQTFGEITETGGISAETPVTTDFDVPQQIIEQAKLIRNVQDTEMVIRLKPEHLGELTLKVSVTANGAVNASFHSDNAQVRGIIESTMVQLKQELQEQGLKVDNIDVRTGLSDNSFLGDQTGQQSGYQQSQQQPSQVRNLRADLDSFAEDAEITAAAAAENIDRAQTVSAEGVDYMV